MAVELHNDLVARLPESLVGYWPLDYDGMDASGNGNGGQPINAEFVNGLWGAALFFDGDDAVLIPDSGTDSALDVDAVLMLAWIMPAQLDVSGDRGIIMNKESVYEYGLQDNSGLLQGAFSPCWRWWGSVAVPIEEWTHVTCLQMLLNHAVSKWRGQCWATTWRMLSKLTCPALLTRREKEREHTYM